MRSAPPVISVREQQAYVLPLRSCKCVWERCTTKGLPMGLGAGTGRSPLPGAPRRSYASPGSVHPPAHSRPRRHTGTVLAVAASAVDQGLGPLGVGTRCLRLCSQRKRFGGVGSAALDGTQLRLGPRALMTVSERREPYIASSMPLPRGAVRAPEKHRAVASCSCTRAARSSPQAMAQGAGIRRHVACGARLRAHRGIGGGASCGAYLPAERLQQRKRRSPDLQMAEPGLPTRF